MNYQDASAQALTIPPVYHPVYPVPSVSPCLFLEKFYQFLAVFSSQNRQIDKIKIIKVPLMLI